jgi:hypothetical protein
MNDSKIAEDLKSLRNQRVYFGHQSVGANVLEGFRALEASFGKGPEMQDALIGQNGDPDGKCEDFARRLQTFPPGTIDIALMKFCYIDFDQTTDVPRLFARYSSTLDALQTRYPSITFVPVTVPLTTRSPVWRRTLKGLMGSPDLSSVVNAKRAEFNRLLEQHYGSRTTVFDLARVESTYPDGSRNEFRLDGQPAFSLIEDYSSDGGHLNELGQTVAARELVHALAAVARARNARVSPL